jgi:hypothetical protein
MVDDTGTITRFTVEDNARTAFVTLSTGGTFRMTDDNDTAFNAMLSVCTAARILNRSVTLTHDAGNTEVDKVTVNT